MIRHRLQFSPKEVLMLRDGQIVRGKITKLFPGNKAEVQLGNHRLIAEILTPLRVGDVYYFQVHHSKSELVRLQVLQEIRAQHMTQQVEQLLRSLGVPQSRQALSFVTELIDERIPFDRQQLRDALQLLEKTSYSRNNRTIITEMIARQLPLTETVFRSLQRVETENLNSLLHQLKNTIHSKPIKTVEERQLLTLLERLSNPQIKQQSFYPQLQKKFFPLIALMQLTNRDQKTTLWTENEQTEWLRALRQFVQREDMIRPLATDLANELLQSKRMTNDTTNEHILQRVQKQFTDKLRPLLPQIMQRTFARTFSLPSQTQIRTLTEMIHTLAQRETYVNANELVQQLETTSFRQLPLQTQFISHFLETVQSLGILFERQLTMLFSGQGQYSKQHVENMKSFLLQMTQQDGSVRPSEQTLPLLQFIQGMQLQTVQEQAHLLLASFIIPGEKLALNKDLYMQFEGKKSEDGTLNPDHCRVLFVLHLKNLHETIIDMQIQKRVISLTIYNAHHVENEIFSPLQTVLAENLSELNYTLSNIKWKPLQERVSPSTKNVEQMMHIRTERYDYRV